MEDQFSEFSVWLAGSQVALSALSPPAVEVSERDQQLATAKVCLKPYPLQRSVLNLEVVYYEQSYTNEARFEAPLIKSSIYVLRLDAHKHSHCIMCDLFALPWPSLASHTHFARMRRGART